MSEDRSRPQQVAGVMGMLRHRYGANLTDQQLEEIERNAESMVAVTETLKAVKLQNGVEPFAVFTPILRDERES